MTTFYPGPSQIYPQIAGYLQDAFNSGILSANHRSKECMSLVEETQRLFHEKLNVPSEFTVYFTSSATECWEIISQSIISDRYIHLFNGAFGQKWYDYSKKLAKKECSPIEFDLNESIPFFEKKIDDVICITQNETSNGTQVKMEEIAKINLEKCLVAVDATSSMAGIELDWELADIWLASVQKCFGLPAGLGIMVCSPKAIHVAEQSNQQTHYNNLLSIDKNMNVFQTTHTPNVLGIYLLNRILKQIPNISITSARIKNQAKEWYNFFKNNMHFHVLTENESVQSDTVIVVKGEPQMIEKLKQETAEIGLILGKGYGKWNDSTFRIANLPAINPVEIIKLKHCISAF